MPSAWACQPRGIVVVCVPFPTASPVVRQSTGCTSISCSHPTLARTRCRDFKLYSYYGSSCTMTSYNRSAWRTVIQRSWWNSRTHGTCMSCLLLWPRCYPSRLPHPPHPSFPRTSLSHLTWKARWITISPTSAWTLRLIRYLCRHLHSGDPLTHLHHHRHKFHSATGLPSLHHHRSIAASEERLDPWTSQAWPGHHWNPWTGVRVQPQRRHGYAGYRMTSSGCEWNTGTFMRGFPEKRFRHLFDKKKKKRGSERRGGQEMRWLKRGIFQSRRLECQCEREEDVIATEVKRIRGKTSRRIGLTMAISGQLNLRASIHWCERESRSSRWPARPHMLLHGMLTRTTTTTSKPAGRMVCLLTSISGSILNKREAWREFRHHHVWRFAISPFNHAFAFTEIRVLSRWDEKGSNQTSLGSNSILIIPGSHPKHLVTPASLAYIRLFTHWRVIHFDDGSHTCYMYFWYTFPSSMPAFCCPWLPHIMASSIHPYDPVESSGVMTDHVLLQDS